MKPTLLLYVYPKLFIDNQYDWDGFDFNEWVDDSYSWDQDPWGGLEDYVTPPAQTISEKSGDCEDFAVVSMNVLHNKGEDVWLAFLYTKELPPVGHVIAYTETHTYSSGIITEESIGEYTDRSRYDIRFSKTFKYR